MNWKRADITDEQVIAACLRARRMAAPWWGVTVAEENGDLSPFALLCAETGAPEKVVWRAMERTQDHGLIDCGVSLRWAWSTEFIESYRVHWEQRK